MTPRRDGASQGVAGAGEAPVARVRIDKWLWAARFYKTRALAADAVENGQARLNDNRVKPSHTVRIGDVVEVRKAGLRWVATVTGASDRRGSASEAATLYRETSESVAEREEEALRQRAAATSGSPPPGRPTKRQRRKLEDFLGEP